MDRQIRALQSSCHGNVFTPNIHPLVPSRVKCNIPPRQLICDADVSTDDGGIFM